MHRFSTFK